MRIVFLGTGTSAGIPMIACSCAVCSSENPRDRRQRTSAAVCFEDASGTQRVVLLDAGPDLRAQAISHGLVRCDAILFTHNHMDHVLGLDEVRRFNAAMKAPIDIYADERTMESLRRMYPHIFEHEGNVNDSFVATLVPWTISVADIAAATPLNLFGMLVTPVPLLHGRLPILGYRFDPTPELRAMVSDEQRASCVPSPFPLAYCTDVSAIPPESWPRLRGLRTLVLDALRHKAHPTHFTVARALDAAHEIGAEQTYLVHMSHDLPHDATQRSLPDNVFLAYDGLVLGPPGG